MQFLWKYIDELVGKGLEWYLVAELLFYASANLVPMALPLAILLASIMTFGSFGEQYELVAMKSSGMSLLRIMFPLIILTMLTSVGAFFFTNNIWPKANLEFASLLYDIRHKKPTFDITEGVFYGGIDGYVIRVDKKDEDGKGLNDVLIYDHSKTGSNHRVIRAERGRMELSDNEQYLIFTLFNGSSYEETSDGKSKPHMLSRFSEEIIRFDLSGFDMERTDKDIFKDNYQMLNLSQLKLAIDTYRLEMGAKKIEFENVIKTRTYTAQIDSATSSLAALITDSSAIARYGSFKKFNRLNVIETAISQMRSNLTYTQGKHDVFTSLSRTINRHEIEWHRKFTLSIACILLFFIGAPLGAIIRKGGLGLPVVISVLFFLAYHITSITFEKLAKQNEMEADIAMWISSIAMLPIGLFLTYQATTDSKILELETYVKAFERIKKKLKPA